MAIIALALAAAVQSASAAPAPPPAPPKVDCTDADHRAFDFWIGEWDVSPTGGTTVVARSKIEKIVGCAISETFDQTVGPGGKAIDYHGRSISSYVPVENAWRQFYLDNSGTAASLTGGVVNGAMVLSNTIPIGMNRMTVTPKADGSVRQEGAFSGDGGKTWTSGYDFTYRKR
jgi:hypothetical protein